MVTQKLAGTITTREISKAARKLERLKLRRRTIVKKLEDIEAEISTARRMLNALVADVTTQANLALAEDDELGREAAGIPGSKAT